MTEENTQNGIVQRSGSFSVDETLDRLKELLRQKGVTLFAIIDHSGEAAKVGLSMPNTKLAIFGNPKAGTPVMLASPTSALDLPLKILVAEDASGEVQITFNDPHYLAHRHSVPADLQAALFAIDAIVQKITG